MALRFGDEQGWASKQLRFRRGRMIQRCRRGWLGRRFAGVGGSAPLLGRLVALEPLRANTAEIKRPASAATSPQRPCTPHHP